MRWRGLFCNRTVQGLFFPYGLLRGRRAEDVRLTFQWRRRLRSWQLRCHSSHPFVYRFGVSSFGGSSSLCFGFEVCVSPVSNW
ncbi:hypothetical protein Bca4012_051536 [Brassica carinata]